MSCLFPDSKELSNHRWPVNFHSESVCACVSEFVCLCVHVRSRGEQFSPDQQYIGTAISLEEVLF